MYYAKGMRDLLRSTQLSMEFYKELDNFQINFIEMCFKQSVDESMGLLTDVERYNLHLFEEYKLISLEEMYGIDSDYFKKVA